MKSEDLTNEQIERNIGKSAKYIYESNLTRPFATTLTGLNKYNYRHKNRFIKTIGYAENNSYNENEENTNASFMILPIPHIEGRVLEGKLLIPSAKFHVNLKKDHYTEKIKDLVLEGRLLGVYGLFSGPHTHNQEYRQEYFASCKAVVNIYNDFVIKSDRRWIKPETELQELIDIPDKLLLSR